jgi:hypothetical protein
MITEVKKLADKELKPANANKFDISRVSSLNVINYHMNEIKRFLKQIQSYFHQHKTFYM